MLDIDLGVSPLVGSPELPIQKAEEDRLYRLPFVKRLAGAVINKRTNLATGVVIAITGPWGSGKSSVLNLLQGEITDSYGERGAIIIRFDPWLISGRDDLIRAFMAEMVAAIRKVSDVDDTKLYLKALANEVAKYGAILSPAANFITPGTGSVAQALFKTSQKLLEDNPGLSVQRQKLEKSLTEIDIPIIALIDEVDRVDNGEIKVMAQLVRAVVAFPNISFVLAYDNEKVTKVLGPKYMEKIVQVSMSLPYASSGELIDLAIAELEQIAKHIPLPKNWASDQQFKTLLDILVPEILKTPRDIKRWISTCHVFGGLAEGEVSPSDLLGWSALTSKAPKTTEAIRNHPEHVLGHAYTLDEAAFRTGGKASAAERRLNRVANPDELEEGIEPLLAYLFPYLAEQSLNSDDINDNAIRNTRPLTTVLRWSLPPGQISHKEIQELLRSRSEKILSTLRKAHDDGRLNILFDRIVEIYPLEKGIDHNSFWSAIAQFCKKDESAHKSSFGTFHEIIRRFSDLFFFTLKKNAAFKSVAINVYNEMLEAGDIDLTSSILRRQLFSYGSYGLVKNEREVNFIEKDAAENMALGLSEKYREIHLQADFLKHTWTLHPVYTMVDTEVWDKRCLNRLQKLSENPEHLDDLTLKMFGAHYYTERKTIDAIANYDWYVEAVRKRLENIKDDEIDPSVNLALHKVINGWP